MKHFAKIISVLISLVMVFGLTSFALAKNPTISFELPETVKVNENFILTINLSNSGQSKNDYISKVKLSSGSEPLKIWTYDKTSFSKEEKWSEKLNLTLTTNTLITAEVTTSKEKTVKKEIFIEVEDVSVEAENQNQQDVSTEPNTTAQEKSRNFGFTFWIFVVVIVIVIVGAIVYVKRKKKGLI